ncbi:MAG: tRNA (N6-threonylcarbamoyladenosine(37)-N6)-methyltransferase TrmO [Lentisphaeria bacterium]|nr:tRNA (N6-threonylcarbamoyladenosine(37)-N6)-methyltransferase TrmO [Lentisphaeria bacterium]
MKYTFEAIGHIRTGARYPQEVPRQGVLTARRGTIILEKQRNFEAALADLAGVERIWIIFVFDRVTGWRPKVRPPLGGTEKKIGVFATRSPHRPNPIGITCARLEGIRELELDVSETDLLDGTPILDIKPYIPLADAFPDARTGWREQAETVLKQVILDEKVLEKSLFISTHGGPDLAEFCRVQLGTRDLDKKRLRLSGPDEHGVFTLAFRTWRMLFHLEDDFIRVTDIFSGYSEEELLPLSADPYGDKELHRLFCQGSVPDTDR